MRLVQHSQSVISRDGSACISRAFLLPFFARQHPGGVTGSRISHSLISTAVADKAPVFRANARDDDGPAAGRLVHRLGE
jgi:hypothetical protein